MGQCSPIPLCLRLCTGLVTLESLSLGKRKVEFRRRRLDVTYLEPFGARGS